jgi:hypothetical protein
VPACAERVDERHGHRRHHVLEVALAAGRVRPPAAPVAHRDHVRAGRAERAVHLALLVRVGAHARAPEPLVLVRARELRARIRLLLLNYYWLPVVVALAERAHKRLNRSALRFTGDDD